MPASAINEMRRAACEILLARRIERLTPKITLHEVNIPPPGNSHPPGEPPICLRVYCHTAAQAQAVVNDAGQVVLSPENAEIFGRGMPPGKLIVSPGRYIPDERRLLGRLEQLKTLGAERLLCENPAHIVLGRKAGYILHGGAGLNVFNSKSVRFWAGQGLCDLTASMELRASEIFALCREVPIGLLAYGRLPLMLLRRCPLGKKCAECRKLLTDRTGRRFPVCCRGDVQELLNADVLWLADKLSELRRAGFLSLLLYDESPDQAAAILRAYQNGQVKSEYTRGLYWRGVE
jgi:putative protease